MSSVIDPAGWDQLSGAEQSAAITAGQRAGQRAANNVFRPFEREGVMPPEGTAQRAQDAARAASFNARQRYTSEYLSGKRPRRPHFGTPARMPRQPIELAVRRARRSR